MKKSRTSDSKWDFRAVAGRDAKWLIPVTALLAVLLFFRLGDYSLWDDEAMTALPALAITQTGDTSAMVGKNLIAYQNGKHLRNMKDRLAPPFAPYVAAVLLGFFPNSAFAARLPFALAGLASFILLIIWIRMEGASLRVSLLVSAGWLCNVSLLLYCRQSRYYAFVVLLTILCGIAYSRYLQGKGHLILISVLMGLLYGFFYLAYFILGACFALDYFIFGRKQRKLSVSDVVGAVLTQAAIIVPVFIIWNPFGTIYSEVATPNTPFQHLSLIWWNIRDMNANEFCSIVFLAIATFAAWRFGKPAILRLGIFLFFYVILTSLVSPQPLADATQADVRYLAGIIPVGILIAALSIDWLAGKSNLMSGAMAVLIFGTNLTNGGLLLEKFRSTPVLFAKELVHPNPEPYTAASDWIKKNVRNGETIWVVPEYMMYPLMFSAPHAIYAWQLDNPPREQFKNLPPIHFKGVVPPDYLIAFGPVSTQLRALMKTWRKQGLVYTEAANLHVFWKDLYRPELFWRSFTPIKDFNPQSDGIFIFHRIKPLDKS